MADEIEKKLDRQAEVLSDLQVSVARLQQQIQHHSEAQQEVRQALQAIATNSKDLSVLHEKVIRMKEDQEHLHHDLHGTDGVTTLVYSLNRRVRTVEMWIGGVKYVISPTMLAVFVEQIFRIWAL